MPSRTSRSPSSSSRQTRTLGFSQFHLVCRPRDPSSPLTHKPLQQWRLCLTLRDALSQRRHRSHPHHETTWSNPTTAPIVVPNPVAAGSALLLVDEINRPNMGLTLDFGHCLAAGENPAQSVAMVGSRGKLFGIQLNDGYTRIGAEDGLIFGSVSSLPATLAHQPAQNPSLSSEHTCSR